MSHFAVVAILPKDLLTNKTENVAEAVQEHLEKVMDRWDENREVEEYEDACWCLDSSVRRWVSDRMHEQFGGQWVDADGNPTEERGLASKFIGGIQTFRESFEPIKKAINAKHPGVPSEFDFDFKWPAKHTPEYEDLLNRYRAKEAELAAAWQEHLSPYTDAEGHYEVEAERLGIRRPNPECGFYSAEFLAEHPREGVKPGDRYEDGSGCGGTGRVKTTYNPDSKWDWYVIGGRFDGDLMRLDPIDDGEGGFNFGDKFHTLQRNLVQLKDGTPEAPYAFLTPDGQWFGRGEMGWWGMSSGDEELDLWAQKWGETRSVFAENYAVQLDCHI